MSFLGIPETRKYAQTENEVGKLKINLRIFLPLLGLLVGPAQSQECTPPDGFYFNMTSQADIDALASSCTTLLGSLIIATTFSGSFIVPNITNITDKVIPDPWYMRPTPDITAIELPDLQYLGYSSLVLGGVNKLERIAFPKLEYIRYLRLNQHIDGARVDLSGLKGTNWLIIEGNYTKISLDSLQNVTGHLSICNAHACGQGAAHHAMEVSLPNLEVAHKLDAVGEISQLALPKLSSADLTIYSEKTPVEIDLPQFKKTTQSLNLQGSITNLSMPSLDQVTENLIIKSHSPLNICLPIVKARDVTIAGKIESLSLPNLKSYFTMTVNSTLDLNCNKLREELKETSAQPSVPWYLSCKSTYMESGLSAKEKVIVGVVVGVGGLIIVIVGFVFWRKKRGKKRKVEVREIQRDGLDDPPPVYTAERG